MEIYNKIIAIILIYIYLILSYFRIFDLNMLLGVFVIMGILLTVYSGWRLKGEHSTSFEYLWKNNKKEFVCNILIVASFIIAIIIY